MLHPHLKFPSSKKITLAKSNCQKLAELNLLRKKKLQMWTYLEYIHRWVWVFAWVWLESIEIWHQISFLNQTNSPKSFTLSYKYVGEEPMKRIKQSYVFIPHAFDLFFCQGFFPFHVHISISQTYNLLLLMENMKLFSIAGYISWTWRTKMWANLGFILQNSWNQLWGTALQHYPTTTQPFTSQCTNSKLPLYNSFASTLC